MNPAIFSCRRRTATRRTCVLPWRACLSGGFPIATSWSSRF